MYCHAGVTAGSNSVNFLTTPPKDHGVNTLYIQPVDETPNAYDMWYNFHINHTEAFALDQCCKEVLSTAKSGDAGVIMILEVEDASPHSSSSDKYPQDSISNALTKVGLTQSKIFMTGDFIAGAEGEKNYGMALFLLEEGYVVARSWRKHKYFAFDIQLWSDFHLFNAIKKEIVAAVGGKLSGKSTSSYRVGEFTVLKFILIQEIVVQPSLTCSSPLLVL